MVSSPVYIMILVTISIYQIVLCEALNKGDRGVCQVTVNLGKRSKSKMTTKNILKCCKGWQYVHATKKCKPQCLSGCLNGICVDVGKCECPPPLVIGKNKQNETICEMPCVNSIRVDSGECECIEDFVKLNETVCIPKCPPGYFNDPYDCKPLCDKPCLNGTCTSRNTCTCSKGYKEEDEFTCIPECAPPCGNEVNARCVAPGSCQCLEGYERKNESCEPVCDQKCVNGICASHNTCKCNAGYELDENNKFNCLLICEGNCVKRHCVSTNNCTCKQGYESAGNTCVPKCDSCENGDCIEPNKCKCHDGYDETSDGSCKPICQVPCINGYCSAFNECTCSEGYYKNGTGSDPCYPREAVECTTCESVCQYEGDNYCCVKKKLTTLCITAVINDPVKAKNTSLAGLGLSWSLGAVLVLVLLLVVVIVMQRTWKNRKQFEDSRPQTDTFVGSIMYTHPESLLQKRVSEDYDDRSTPDDLNAVTVLLNNATNQA